MSSVLQVACEAHAVAPSVAVRVWLRGGLLAEGSPGTALASGRMLVEGSARRSWQEIAAGAEQRGIDLHGFAGHEVSGVAIDALAGDWRTAVELAAELVLETEFPAERCTWVCSQTMGELVSLAEQPEVLAGWAFLEQLYGSHPWGRPMQGTPAALEALSPRDCRSFHHGALDRGVIVSVVGDIDQSEVRPFLDESFAELGTRQAVPWQPPAVEMSDELVREIALPSGEQAHLYLGHLTVPLDHSDRVALELASVILGAGPGLVGRIPERVREQEGLAYVASASAVSGAGSAAGRLVVYLGTSGENVARARSVVVEELERLLEQGVRDEEVDEARQYLLASDPFRRETARQIAVLKAQALQFDLPLDRPEWLAASLADLDREEVNAAIRRHIDPDELRTTVGLPPGT